MSFSFGPLTASFQAAKTPSTPLKKAASTDQKLEQLRKDTEHYEGRASAYAKKLITHAASFDSMEMAQKLSSIDEMTRKFSMSSKSTGQSSPVEQRAADVSKESATETAVEEKKDEPSILSTISEKVAGKILEKKINTVATNLTGLDEKDLEDLKNGENGEAIAEKVMDHFTSPVLEKFTGLNYQDMKDLGAGIYVKAKNAIVEISPDEASNVEEEKEDQDAEKKAGKAFDKGLEHFLGVNRQDIKNIAEGVEAKVNEDKKPTGFIDGISKKLKNKVVANKADGSLNKAIKHFVGLDQNELESRANSIKGGLEALEASEKPVGKQETKQPVKESEIDSLAKRVSLRAEQTKKALAEMKSKAGSFFS